MRFNIKTALISVILLLLLPFSLTGCRQNKQENDGILSIDDLNGRDCAVQTGTVFDELIKTAAPECQIRYANSDVECAELLHMGKVSAYVADEPIARLFAVKYPEQKILATLSVEGYGFIFNRDDEESARLCERLNAFLSEITQSGEMDEIKDRWFGSEEANMRVDLDTPDNTNGVITYAIDGVTKPFCYTVAENEVAGLEVDIMARFCRANGYGLNIVKVDFSGLLSGVQGKKYDIASSCIAITEERKQAVLFSDPYYEGGIVVVTNDPEYVDTKRTVNVFQSVAESFNNTFIKEDRWRMFLDGIGITLLITLLSAIFGTLLGFLVYLLYRKGIRWFNTIIDELIRISEKMPSIVVLMVLYYIIFNSSELSNIWISIIGFMLTFSCSVVTLFKAGVDTIDVGQTEAALALGYTEQETFFKILFPQSLPYLLSGYKSLLISLVKDTAIVGYIAVQDLTKISDIIRSRSYEAFFPLLATALLYVLLADLLILLIKLVELSLKTEARKHEKNLKGVKNQ